ERAEAAARQSLESGGQQAWSNPETGASGSVISTPISNGGGPDLNGLRLAPGVELASGYESAPTSYQAGSTLNLRARPSTRARVVGKLQGGEVVNVIGRVSGSAWVLVARSAARSSRPSAPPTARPRCSTTPPAATPAATGSSTPSQTGTAAGGRSSGGPSSAFPPTQRVLGLHHLAQAVLGHVGVDLGGGDVGVAEQGLHGPKVRPALQQVGGEGVAQHVGADPLRIDARRQRRLVEQLRHAPRGQPPAGPTRGEQP